MAIDIQIIASRLAKMRETLAYDLSEVAIGVGIDENRLKELESGQYKPSGDEVLILADFYRCDFIALIDKNVPAPFDNTAPLFRRYGNSFSVEDKRAVQDFLFLCQREKTLEQLLSKDKIDFSFHPQGDLYKQHGSDAANELRFFLHHDSSKLPLNLYADFRSIGVHIFRRRLNSKNISGLYIKDAIAGHCVLINYDEDVYRQRFSVAHEVAHAIFDSKDNYLLSFKSESQHYSKDDLVEIRANNFASNYLIPVDILNKPLSIDSSNAVEWCNKLKVSSKVLAISLKNHRNISEDEFNAIKRTRIPSHEKIDPEIPTDMTIKQREQRQYFLELGLSNYYVDLCFDAYDRDLISVGYLIESLGIDHSSLGEVCELYRRTIKHGF